METITAPSRRTGKYNAFLISMKDTIEKGGNVGVAGCKNPQPIIDQLKRLGVKTKSEPMYRTTPVQVVWSFLGIPLGIDGGEKVCTGYVFEADTK